MLYLAGTELCIVFFGIVLYIWRLQFVVPDFALYLLGFLVLTFFVHRDSFRDLGFGSSGLLSGMKLLFGPTLILAGILVIAGILSGAFRNWTMNLDKALGSGRYFAWCLFQQFGLQSFFTNRLEAIVAQPRRVALLSAAVFAIFHIPNPVLMPVTFVGGYILSRVFLAHRNLIPLAVSQAVVGITLSLVLPAAWHHGLRVGPGYYQFH